MNKNNIGENVKIKLEKENNTEGVFTISGLYPGYGVTIANSLRRALLSSLKGSAITFIKVKGVDHEFTVINGMVEDVVELSMNLKKIRFKMHSDEPQTITLKSKGEGDVKASDIKLNSEIEIMNKDQHIATLSGKSAELDIEITVERGFGYVQANNRKDEKLDIGRVAVDSLFSPVTKVNYTIEDVRVGDRTNYNQINLTIETDGTIKPKEALIKSASILKEHFAQIEDSLDENKKTDSIDESK
ncbi:MAG: DNA-directed RNA polymerase subunit alpha [Candidatus Liptonbacteria bacterium CG11_big_fil_rev_8_21_14_0_20_35_14]|uniref:DNA-directed RNA polymerase subunit alpha n=1 Tax=Candidatus Liptonbacteria bacterium CG11_big_fil_rev_8_21_14_0_20_35_14 TaxID=1974634 RepID=A0A2H0N7G1_9BACT|nr:MAG: DNA-directed RNA polymerase subunit alpha [Candidatus Liptonbacteria bacterium CG11_big_fil_rev_8_21_14_0_20_35_14]